MRCTGYLQLDQTVELNRDAQPVQLVISRVGAIRGQLRGDASGTPQRLRVVAESTTPAFQRGPRPARLPSSQVQDNSFVFDALEPGRYHLQLRDMASGDDIAIAHTVVEVAVGQECFVVLNLKGRGTSRD